ncbi:hypothetical protein F4809DRAFT_641814 [Biscogniauxia mediterranea]|nr:hypothetical protein F4809DRAFT_641814 [Biscogniauxia mediterranea]
MAGPSSSVGVNLGGCPSDPHGLNRPQTGYDSMQAERLSPLRPNNEDFTDRLVGGRPYDHQASMEARLATFSTQFNTNGPNRPNAGT